MQSNGNRSSAKDVYRRRHGQGLFPKRQEARNQDDQGHISPASMKRPIRVVIIDSSDEESGDETLTAAFATLATSEISPERSPERSGASLTQQGTPVQVHHNGVVCNRSFTPSAPREQRYRPAPSTATVSPAPVSTTDTAAAPALATARARAPALAVLATPAPASSPAAAPFLPNDPPPAYTFSSGQPHFYRALEAHPPSGPMTPQGRRKYYVVSVGKCTGIFDQWHIVNLLTSGVSGAAQKSYKSYGEALEVYIDLKARRLVHVKREPGDELLFGPIEFAMQ